MKRMINMGSIEQFASAVSNVKSTTQYVGQDENDNPVFDNSIKLPKIKVTYTEKTHGTNIGISYSELDGIWVQSRKSIITPQKDNVGGAFLVEQNKDSWLKIINDLAYYYNINLNEKIITVYGELCGGSIQKNANVSGLEKMIIIFEYFKVSPLEPQKDEENNEDNAFWLRTIVDGKPVSSDENRIFNVLNFTNFSTEVDFNDFENEGERLMKIALDIEAKSPIACAFGKPDNIGEGAVFTFKLKDSIQKFKMKGEKHSMSGGKKGNKQRVKKEQDPVLTKLLNEVADKVTPDFRLDQMYNLANDTVNGGTPDMKNISTFIRMVNDDIIKEEMEVLKENGLEIKQIFGVVSKMIVPYFKTRMLTDLK